MKKLIALTLAVRQLENSMNVCAAFKQPSEASIVNVMPFKSAVLTVAYNKLREARMLCGDLLRLVGVENPYNNAYTGELKDENPAYLENGELKNVNWKAVCSPSITPDAFEQDEDGKFNGSSAMKKHFSEESVCIGYLKTQLGDIDKGLFYELLKMKEEVFKEAMDRNQDSVEFDIYFLGAANALKLANCNLGLRFGELVK